MASLRYTFKNLQSQASSVQSHLVSIQTEFKTRLKDSVEVFKKDMSTFVTSYSEVCLIEYYFSNYSDVKFDMIGRSYGNWPST